MNNHNSNENQFLDNKFNYGEPIDFDLSQSNGPGSLETRRMSACQSQSIMRCWPGFLPRHNTGWSLRNHYHPPRISLHVATFAYIVYRPLIYFVSCLCIYL